MGQHPACDADAHDTLAYNHGESPASRVERRKLRRGHELHGVACAMVPQHGVVCSIGGISNLP